MQLEGVRPEQQIKSSVCPLIWVGKSVKMWKPELSRQDEKSQVRGRVELSRWILKSPSRITLGEIVERWASRAAISFKN